MSYQIKKSNGQALLEFVLVIPMLLGLLLILFDLGRVTFYYGSLNNAAREGARYGIVLTYDGGGNFNEIGIEDETISSAVGVTGGPVTADAFLDSFNVDTADEYYVVRVVASHPYTPATPFVAGLISGGGSTITLTSQAQMVVE